MLRKTLTQMKELEFGSLVSNKYFELLGVEDFYIEDSEDLIAGLQFIVENSVREDTLSDLLRKNQRVQKELNVFLNNNKHLIKERMALIYANRVDQLWLAVKKYIEMYSHEYISQCNKKEFINELSNLTLPE